MLGKGRDYVHLCCCVSAQLWLVLGIRRSPRLLTPFPQKSMLMYAQSIPSALAVTVKVIILQFGFLYREHHPSIDTVRHPLADLHRNTFIAVLL